MAIAHGNTTISIEEDIVIIKSIGSFNQESIKQSFQEVKTLIKSIFPKKFKFKKKKYYENLRCWKSGFF